jgi:hypothetical protein
MTITAFAVDPLYKPHRGRVEFVEVPELAFLRVSGRGAPEDPGFTAAVQALFSTSYATHFLVRKAFGEAPHVMPLEALWWVEDGEGGEAAMGEANRERWCWQAMVMQPDPIDAAVVAEALAQGRTKDLPALDQLVFTRWEEGPCAQLLHVGPYAAEAPSLQRLHEAIARNGMKARGRHHEIYLGDPRRSAPERLRTILRQPVEPL